MKKIIVCSDSHGNKEAINKLLSKPFDYFFFLGDGLDDLGAAIYDERVKVVRGNCDFNSTEKENTIVVVENVMFFLTHGHLYGVKESFFRLFEKVKELVPSLVLFGHTHKMEQFDYRGIKFANPGAITTKRGGFGTYFVVTVDGGKYYIEKCTI